MPTEIAQAPQDDDALDDLIDIELKDAGPGIGDRMGSKERAKLRVRVEAIRTVAELAPMLDELLFHVRQYPTDETLQRFVAVALGRVQDTRAASVWRGIDRRFPDSDTAPVRVARELYKTKGPDAADAYIQQRLSRLQDDPEQRFLLARVYAEVRKFEAAEDILLEIIEHPESTASVLIKTTRLLLKNGRLSDAENAAQVLVSKFGDTHAHTSLLHEVDQIRGIADASYGKSGASVLAPIIDKVLNAGREIARPNIALRSATSLGSVVMIIGSLAPGGAERQFVVTALGLHQAMQAGYKINGVDIQGPLALLSRSNSSRADDDFYLPHLEAAGLRVHEYSEFEPFGGRARKSLSRFVSPLLPHLPSRTQEGIIRLADVLKYLSPEVVHIWQDGSILAAGAAAFLAGVPRIILGARTMPPTERHDREKPEYYPIFRGLLREPGVTLVSNSHLVAGRYADWLEIDRREVRVIPNGVAAPEPNALPTSLELAKSLPNRGERFVVGAVMRFAEVKRPLLWLDCAAAILAKCPDAYFVMVGKGPLLEAAVARATALGIRDRVLFTGATPDVGFWFSQMDVLLLLSRYEGLPNVLIEAQMCGVPVVTTPSGGSGEALDPGVTGTVLESIEIENLDTVVDAVLSWRRSLGQREALGTALKEWASSQFSVERMLELTVQTYME
jgi:glycosyltransferase involved in cell wall biosynthesis